MPEGDTVFKLACYLQAELCDRILRCGHATGIVGGRAEVEFTGRRIEEVYARGKHLFIAFDDGRLLRSHLGMWGSWHAYAPTEDWRRPRARAKVVLDRGDRVFVCFNPQQVEVMRRHGVRDHMLRETIGPDLLDPQLDTADILRRAAALAGPDALLIDVLLDQRIASGIGNVYKSELLFLAGYHPSTRFAALDDEALSSLYRRASQLLAGNTQGGPRVTRRANDQAGVLWVYGRTGQPCHRCDSVILSSHLGRGMRSTFWCPSCQPLPAETDDGLSR